MHPLIRLSFDQILRSETISGPVLEVGALPDPDSLLSLPSLEHIDEKVGVNREPFPSTDAIKFVTADANDMCLFKDHYFGCVLCNAMLEHDAMFWRTLSEIRRVTAPGGLIVIGVPGYRGMGVRSWVRSGSWPARLLAILAALTRHDALLAGTLTLGEHFYPHDYYRFSEQAVRDVFLSDLLNPSCRWLMQPPRIIGWGRRH